MKLLQELQLTILIWDRLVYKYAPKTAPSYIQLKNDFANSKLLSVDTNPDKWMTELECLRSEMNKVKISGKTDISEVDLIIHIISNLLDKYRVAVSKLEEKLKDTSTPLKMSTVQVKLNSRYDSITRHVEAKGEERAIAPFKKQYKGICGNCGEIGHKKSGCLKNKSRDKKGHDRVTSRGFKGKCFLL